MGRVQSGSLPPAQCHVYSKASLVARFCHPPWDGFIPGWVTLRQHFKVHLRSIPDTHLAAWAPDTHLAAGHSSGRQPLLMCTGYPMQLLPICTDYSIHSLPYAEATPLSPTQSAQCSHRTASIGTLLNVQSEQPRRVVVWRTTWTHGW